jgi:hypothetical protein
MFPRASYIRVDVPSFVPVEANFSFSDVPSHFEPFKTGVVVP